MHPNYQAVPPTPWDRDVEFSQVHSSDYIHPETMLIGDVRLGPNVLIAPGTSIRADEGSPFYIGANTNADLKRTPGRVALPWQLLKNRQLWLRSSSFVPAPRQLCAAARD